MIESSAHSSSIPRGDEWRLLSPLLDQALDLDPEKRRALIEAQDPEIADRLEDLLHEHTLLASDRFLERGRIDLPPSTATFAGQIIGPFRVESHIGQGGMGSVWRARRVDGRFERTVALKFLNVAFLGESGERRFRREGRILALLSDPHIAELIDAGVTAAGQPYLVLEYVDGQPIDQYCDQARLHIDSRIRLFLQVLDAVSTAHANLIVHRDIKPSNVLVRKDGEVKLLDFGVAKLIERDELSVQTTFTVGSSALTPEFAAPEQLKHETITVSTDVYSLGVLLYLLLTGHHPAEHHLHSPAELIKAVVDCEPVRPSDAVASPFGVRSEDESLASLRSTSTDRLKRTLRGDLDTIVLKALKKDPRERYASVSLFAADLRRYLHWEPIGARPDTLMYRTGKFIRRNRTAVTLTTLAFAAIAAGAAGTLLQSKNASTERDLAVRHLARAERMTDLTELLLSDTAPVGKSLAVDQLLDREEHLIDRERNPDPGNHVELLLSVGSQYSSEDHNAQALPVLNNAYALSRTLRTAKDAPIRAKASCVLAGALVPVGELARAESLYREGLHELGTSPQFASERSLCLLRGSQIASESGNTEEAISRARAAEEAIQGSPLHFSLQGINVLMNLATVLGDAGKFREADQHFQEVSSLMWDLGYDNSQRYARLFNNWGMTLAYDGRQLEAEKTYRHALKVSQNDETNDTIAPGLLFNYATLLHQLNRDKEAGHYLQLASTSAQDLHDNILADNADLLRAEMLTDDHQYDRASRLLDEVEQRLRRRYPAEHYDFAQIASDRSAIAMAHGDVDSATKFAQQAVAIDEASIRRIGQCAAYLPTLLVQESQVDLRAGRLDAAAADARRALDLLQNGAGTPSSNVGRANLALAQALQAAGSEDQAQLASRRAFADLQPTLGLDHPATRLAAQLAESHPPGQ